jgi:pimeloyl-ACP methyl ester carboxylesterase
MVADMTPMFLLQIGKIKKNMKEKKAAQHLKLNTNQNTPIPFKIKAVQTLFSTAGWVFPKAMARFAYRIFTRPLSRAQHKYSDSLLEQAHVFAIPFKDYDLKMYSWGDGEEIVLLIHGWESRGTALRSLVPTLLEQGYKVVTFDAPAHGNSGGAWVNMPLYAEAIRTVLLQLGKVKSAIAHSFGGSSLVYLMSFMDRSIALENLVLIATPSNIQQIFEGFAKMLHLPTPVRIALYTHIKQLTGIGLPDYHLEKFAPKMQVNNILIVHDQQDTIVPFSDGQAYYHTLNNAKIHVTNGLGHFKLVKDATVITEISDFIGSAIGCNC